MKRSGIFCAFLLVLIFLSSTSLAVADESHQIAIRNVDVCLAIKAIAGSFQHNFIAQSSISLSERTDRGVRRQTTIHLKQ